MAAKAIIPTSSITLSEASPRGRIDNSDGHRQWSEQKGQRTGVDLVGKDLGLVGVLHTVMMALPFVITEINFRSRNALIVHINGYVLLLKLGSCGGKFGTALACEVQGNLNPLLRVIAGGGAFNIGGALRIMSPFASC